MTPSCVVGRYMDEVLGGARPESADELLANGELAHRTARLRSAFPDLEIETQVLLAEAELVACHFVGQGTHLGLFQGVPPTGQAFVTHCTAVYRVEEGRIADAWVTWDYLALMEQLGAVERVAGVSA